MVKDVGPMYRTGLFRFTCMLALGTLLVAAPALAGSVGVAWDPSTGATDYHVHFGPSPGNYTQTLDVGAATQATVPGLADCTLTYFAVSASNSAGESGLSSEVSSWPRPAITTSSVSNVDPGTQVDLVLTGTNFQNGSTVSFSNPGVIVNSAGVDSCGQISLNISVQASAPAGPTDVTVTLPNGVAGTATGLLTVVDSEAPSVPTGLQGAVTGGIVVQLSWNPSTDSGNSGLAGYRIYRDGSLAGSTQATSYSDGGLQPHTTYSYRVSAYDNAGNESAQSSAVSVTTQDAPQVLLRINAGGGDFTDSQGQAWSADTGFNTGDLGSTSSAISGTADDLLFQTERWDDTPAPELMYSFDLPSGDYTLNLYFAEIYTGAQSAGSRVFDVEVEGQLVLDDLDIFAEAGGFTALQKSVPVTVLDGQLNIQFLHQLQNPKVSAIEVLSAGGASDTEPPSTPQSLTGNAASATQIDLGWAASTDSGGSGLAGYRVRRDGAVIATTAGTTYSDLGVQPDTQYVYTVAAFDNAGNESAPSSPVTVTTPPNQNPLPPVQNLRRTDQR